MHTKDQALKVAREIIEVETQMDQLKAKLANLEREFENIIHSRNETSIRNSFMHGSSSYYLVKSMEPMSIATKIKSLFESNPDQSFSIDAIQHMVPNAKPETVRSTLSRLAKDEKLIKSTIRGHYKYLVNEDEEHYVK